MRNSPASRAVMTSAAMSWASRSERLMSLVANPLAAGSEELRLDARLVRKNEGHSTDTAIPEGSSSQRRLSEIATTAALTAVYEDMVGGCTSPAREAVLTRCPWPLALSTGTNVRQPRATP